MSGAELPRKSDLAEFCAEARRLDLTAGDVFPGVALTLDTFDAYKAMSKLIQGGKHLTLCAGQFLDSINLIELKKAAAESLDYRDQDVASLRMAIEADQAQLQAEEIRTDAWSSLLEAMHAYKRRSAAAETALEGLMTLQEVWNLAGGNPEIKPTREDVVTALKTLDQVCDEADQCLPDGSLSPSSSS